MPLTPLARLVSLRYTYDHIVSHIVTRVTPLYPPFDVLCIHWSFRLRIYSHIVTTRHCYRHFASHVFTFNLLRSRSAISIQLLLYVRQTKGLAQPIARAPRRDTPHAKSATYVARNNGAFGDPSRSATNTKRALPFLPARYPQAIADGL